MARDSLRSRAPCETGARKPRTIFARQTNTAAWCPLYERVASTKDKRSRRRPRWGGRSATYDNVSTNTAMVPHRRVSLSANVAAIYGGGGRPSGVVAGARRGERPQRQPLLRMVRETTRSRLGLSIYLAAFSFLFRRNVLMHQSLFSVQCVMVLTCLSYYALWSRKDYILQGKSPVQQKIRRKLQLNLT